MERKMVPTCVQRMLLANLLSHLVTLPVFSQDVWLPVRAIETARVRVVFPETAGVQTDEAERIIEAFLDQSPIPGLPDELLAQTRVTISLATEPVQLGIDGWSSPSERLIVLPLKEARRWESSKLHRVIRHELAHIASAVFGIHQRTPRWFQEGFAEWAAGGTTCEGQTRIRLEMLRRRAEGEDPPRLFEPEEGLARRLSYDLFSSFFEFLEVKKRDVITKGTLMASVKTHGVETGLLNVFGTDVKELEVEWRSYLLERFDGTLNEISCASGLNTNSSRYATGPN